MTHRPDFDGIWAKIDRAKEHRDVLEGEVGTVTGTRNTIPPRNRIELSMQFEVESGYHVFRAKALIPDERLRRWGLVLGDTIQNLRGALDHLVWQLSLYGREGRNPRNPKTVQFPLQKTPLPDTSPEDFLGGKKQALWDVAPRHRAIIEGYQPYNRGHAYGDFIVYPFAWLRDFSNTDKHRVVVPPRQPGGEMTPLPDVFAEAASIADFLDTGFGKYLKPGAEVKRVKVVPPTFQRNVDVAGYLTPYVCFPYFGVPSTPNQSPADRAVPVINAVDLMSTLVIKVVREFEPLF